VRSLALLLVLLAPAACGHRSRPAPAPAAPAPAPAWSDQPVAREHPGGSTLLRAVRTSEADGATRLVFEFEGRVPSYRVGYATAVQECGSGENVALPGSARLVVAFRNAAAHDDAGHATVADRDRRPGLPGLLALRLFCDFEGDVSWAAALPRRSPFAVSELSSPPRLLVRLAPASDGGR
jgi:hypothetical protein